jgi:hypothetical protein
VAEGLFHHSLAGGWCGVSLSKDDTWQKLMNSGENCHV